ncbi:hypothetical protein [Luteolibacter sp. LG18]|uniref:hypothetical protein n=1 Tax=Luteolibacter sp. LG18 TaxID=2819286 RepID=UPI002B2EEE5A|nr:hypothetical protein llg_14000 [Luteolibacter sp. LG18]
MSLEANPYAAPAEISAPPVVVSGSDLVRRDGKNLLIWDAAVLPARCIRTNAPIGPDDWTRTKKMVFTPPWIWVTLVAGLLLPLILSLVLQKKFTITYSLSKAERARFRNRTIWGWSGFFLGMILIGTGIASLGNSSDAGGLILGAGILILIAGLVFVAIANPLKVIRHRDGWFVMKGASPAFLDSIGPA